ncbi:hypothetical protein ACFQ67_00250 [Streptomyces sp. NPDC056488]|uniref:hypothetical protein n=1 Tax=Streptomyces sp. NPDC056488 TaxID=3345836 RepID=UPI0036CE5AB3
MTDHLHVAAERALDALNDLIRNTYDPGAEALGARYELAQALTPAPAAARQATGQADTTPAPERCPDWPECDHWFFMDGCTCIAWTKQTDPPRPLLPGESLDMVNHCERRPDCPHHAPAPVVGQPAATPDTDYDRDPAAIAWARRKIQDEIDRCRKFHASATEAGKPEQAEMWRRLANRMERTFMGGDGCVIAYFDERLPTHCAAIDKGETR